MSESLQPASPGSTPLQGTVRIRAVDDGDADALAAALTRHRDYLKPWEPVRPESFYTLDGQRKVIADAKEAMAAGRGLFWVLYDGAQVVGRISLADIVRGAFQNGHLGYWIAQDYQGRGLATAATRFACTAAAELGLHRVQAGTLLHNVASRTVLARCGFTTIGAAENYLKINGSWQDHVLFQKILTP
ncbi:GNAT family N-acetyltransferase [Arthrobacter sp. TMN-49]